MQQLNKGSFKFKVANSVTSPKVVTFGTTSTKFQSKGDIHLMESQKKGVERQDRLKVSIFSAQRK